MAEFDDYGSIDGFMAVMIALLFFATVYALEAIGTSVWFRPWFRELLADYAYPVRLDLLLDHELLNSRTDCYHLLDWLLAHPRHTQEGKR